MILMIFLIVRIRRRTGSCQQDGSYLSSRRNGNNLYLFTSYAPDTTEGADAKVKYIPRIGDDYIAYDHIYLPVPEDTTDYTYNGKNYLVVSSVAGREARSGFRQHGSYQRVRILFM